MYKNRYHTLFRYGEKFFHVTNLRWDLVLAIRECNSLYLLTEKALECHCRHQRLNIADTNNSTLNRNTLA